MYLSSAETRARIGVSREKLQQLIRSGELKASKLGDARNSPYRIAEADLSDYMDRMAAKVAAGSAA